MKNAIHSHLPGNFPWQVQYFDTIDSTNSYAKTLAAAGAPHGTVIIAGQQTGGRGRMGRSFNSADQAGVYLSILLRPNCPATELMHLTCCVAVAVCDAVENCCNYRPQIKWINDLIAQGKKLGGILTEMSVNPATGLTEYAVIGIGINCRQQEFPQELQDIAITLETVTKQSVSPFKLTAHILIEMEKMDNLLLTNKTQIIEKYKQNCITLGQDIYLIQTDNKTPCRALNIDENGSLLVEYPDKTREFINSGEVSVRPQ